MSKCVLCIVVCMCACALTQSGLTLCNPVDCSLPASSVHGIFQARMFEWVAISSSRGYRFFFYFGIFLKIKSMRGEMRENLYFSLNKRLKEGFPSWFSSLNSALPLQGAQIWSLTRELISCLPCCVARKKRGEIIFTRKVCLVRMEGL